MLHERWQWAAGLMRTRGWEVVPYPDSTDPHEAIMAIDQMLTRVTGRPPLVIRTGPPIEVQPKPKLGTIPSTSATTPETL